MTYRLLPSEFVLISIDSKEYFSSESINVCPEEKYLITCFENYEWSDWFIKSKPTGYFNIFAFVIGLRVKKVKCFCLCGAFNKNDKTAFPIGNFAEVYTKQDDGTLSFFANDTKGFYFNNKGSIQIKILRIK